MDENEGPCFKRRKDDISSAPFQLHHGGGEKYNLARDALTIVLQHWLNNIPGIHLFQTKDIVEKNRLKVHDTFVKKYIHDEAAKIEWNRKLIKEPCKNHIPEFLTSWNIELQGLDALTMIKNNLLYRDRSSEYKVDAVKLILNGIYKHYINPFCLLHRSHLLFLSLDVHYLYIELWHTIALFYLGQLKRHPQQSTIVYQIWGYQQLLQCTELLRVMLIAFVKLPDVFNHMLNVPNKIIASLLKKVGPAREIYSEDILVNALQPQSQLRNELLKHMTSLTNFNCNHPGLSMILLLIKSLIRDIKSITFRSNEITTGRTENNNLYHHIQNDLTVHLAHCSCELNHRIIFFFPFLSICSIFTSISNLFVESERQKIINGWYHWIYTINRSTNLSKLYQLKRGSTYRTPDCCWSLVSTPNDKPLANYIDEIMQIAVEQQVLALNKRKRHDHFEGIYKLYVKLIEQTITIASRYFRHIFIHSRAIINVNGGHKNIFIAYSNEYRYCYDRVREALTIARKQYNQISGRSPCSIVSELVDPLRSPTVSLTTHLTGLLKYSQFGYQCPTFMSYYPCHNSQTISDWIESLKNGLAYMTSSWIEREIDYQTYKFSSFEQGGYEGYSAGRRSIDLTYECIRILESTIQSNAPLTSNAMERLRWSQLVALQYTRWFRDEHVSVPRHYPHVLDDHEHTFTNSQLYPSNYNYNRNKINKYDSNEFTRMECVFNKLCKMIDDSTSVSHISPMHEFIHHLRENHYKSSLIMYMDNVENPLSPFSLLWPIYIPTSRYMTFRNFVDHVDSLFDDLDVCSNYDEVISALPLLPSTNTLCNWHLLDLSIFWLRVVLEILKLECDCRWYGDNDVCVNFLHCQNLFDSFSDNFKSILAALYYPMVYLTRGLLGKPEEKELLQKEAPEDGVKEDEEDNWNVQGLNKDADIEVSRDDDKLPSQRLTLQSKIHFLNQHVDIHKLPPKVIELLNDLPQTRKTVWEQISKATSNIEQWSDIILFFVDKCNSYHVNPWQSEVWID